MQANATKFHYMHTSKDTDTEFRCEGINIKSEDMVRNALKRNSKILNIKTKMFIYHAFIEAYLNNCPLIWMNRNKTDMKNIENASFQNGF